MHKIPFSQRAIAADRELQTHFEAHETEMVLTVAEEVALEEWYLVMYSTDVRLDILRCITLEAAILEDRERRNTESAPYFFNRIMDPDLRVLCSNLDAEGKIKALDISRIGCNWYKRFLTRHRAVQSPAVHWITTVQ